MPSNLGLFLNGLDHPPVGKPATPQERMEMLDDIPVASSYEELVRELVVSAVLEGRWWK